MFDVILHTGLEHPSLVWVLVPAVLAFLGGLLLGKYKAHRETSRESTPAK